MNNLSLGKIYYKLGNRADGFDVEDDNTWCSIRYLLYALPPSHPVGKDFLRTPSVSITPETLERKFSTITVKRKYV